MTKVSVEQLDAGKRWIEKRFMEIANEEKVSVAEVNWTPQSLKFK